MTFEAMRFYLEVIQFAATLAIGLYAWWTRRDRIADHRFSSLEKRIGEIEAAVKHPPHCEYHSGFEHRLDKVNSGISRVEGRLDGIGRAVDLMNQFLIEQGGK